MPISHFVLLMCGLVVGGLTSTSPRQTRTYFPSSSAAEMPLSGLDSVEFVGAFTVQGNKQKLCAAFGRPEECCPLAIAYRGASQTYPPVFRFSDAVSCFDSTIKVRRHTFKCPTAVGGSAWAIDLRYVSGFCFEHLNQAVAAFRPIRNDVFSILQSLCGYFILGAMGPTQTLIVAGNLAAGRLVLVCAPNNCNQGEREDVNPKGQDYPISDEILEIPTAWRAKVGEFAVKSQAEENWDGKNGNRRLRRLGAVVMGLVVITVVMFVF